MLITIIIIVVVIIKMKNKSLLAYMYSDIWQAELQQGSGTDEVNKINKLACGSQVLGRHPVVNSAIEY